MSYRIYQTDRFGTLSEPIIMWCSGALFVDGVFALFLLVFGLVQIEVTHRKLFEERAQALERDIALLRKRIACLEQSSPLGACSRRACVLQTRLQQRAVETVRENTNRRADGGAVCARVHRAGGSRAD